MERWILRQRQGLPLQVKVELTKLRIRQWYEHYDSDCYFSFSGGKQSTILLAIIRMMYSDIPGVFVDTGLEFPGVRRFVRFMQNHIFHWAEEGETIKDISQRYNVAVDDILDSNSSRDIKFTANTRFKMKFPVYVPKLNGGNIVILKPDTSFRETIQKYGYAVGTKKVSQTIYKLRHHNLSDRYRNYLLNGDDRGNAGKLPECHKYLLDAPFEISSMCCHERKTKHLIKYAKKTGRLYPITGEITVESKEREKTYLENGCNGYNMSSPKSTPMGPWTEQDTLRYIYDNYLLISDEYGKVVFKNGMFETTDEKRTGCMYCACGVHKEAKNEPNRFQRLKRKYPKLHEYCMKDWAEGGLGLGNVLDYMGIEYGDYIDTLENYEQLSLLDGQMEFDTYQYPLNGKGICKCFNFEDFYKPVRVDKIICNEETEEAKNNIIVAS